MLCRWLRGIAVSQVTAPAPPVPTGSALRVVPPGAVASWLERRTHNPAGRGFESHPPYLVRRTSDGAGNPPIEQPRGTRAQLALRNARVVVDPGLFRPLRGGGRRDRLLLRRRISEERRTALVDHKGLCSPVGTVFAFLIGFAITMGVGCGERRSGFGGCAVGCRTAVVVVEQQHLGSGGRPAHPARPRDLPGTVRDPDWKALASGTYGALPSAKAFSALQDTVHDVSYRAARRFQRAAP